MKTQRVRAAICDVILAIYEYDAKKKQETAELAYREARETVRGAEPATLSFYEDGGERRTWLEGRSK